MDSSRRRPARVALASVLAFVALSTGAAATVIPSGAPGVGGLSRQSLALVGTVVAGLLVVRFAPTNSREVVQRLRAEPGDSLLVGLVVVLGTGLVMAVYVAAIAGYPLALPALATYGAFLLAANVLGTLALGAALVERVAEGSLLTALGVGVAVTSLAGLVEPLGWVLSLLLGVLGVGAFAKWFCYEGSGGAVSTFETVDTRMR